jgi:3-oxoacyl-[acyl-carrier-protein] synthase-3
VRTPEIYLASVGSFLPDKLSVSDAVALGLVDPREAEEYELSSITVAGEIPAPDMALSAVRTALNRCSQDPAELDLLLYASVWHQGPPGWCPQYYIQRHVRAGRATAAEARQGCMGIFSALELAAGYLHGHESGTALLTSGDNFNSPAIDRWRTSPHYVMADGGCALILSTKPGFARLRAICSVTLPEYEERHRDAEPLFPPGAATGRRVDYTATEQRWAETTPPDAPLHVVRTQDELVQRTLAEADVDLDDIARVAYVHASRSMIEGRAMVPLGLPMSKSTWDFCRTTGHVGASDQILALDHLVTTGGVGVGDHVLLLGLGPGLNIACAVVEILERPMWTE